MLSGSVTAQLSSAEYDALLLGEKALKPQTRQVLGELRNAGSFGRTRVDFLHTMPPVLNVAARVRELRDAGYQVVPAGRRDRCRIYRLAGRSR
jgi:hypothetical protein